MTGWVEEEVLGELIHVQHHHSRANGEHYPRHECPIYAALQDGEVHHITDEVFWHKDGTCFPVHYTSTPIWEHGDIIGAVVVFQDVSGIKQTEAELTLLQHRNAMVLAAAGEGICGFDCQGNVTFSNPVATQMLAWQPESGQAQTIHDLFGRDQPNSEEYCPIHNIMAGKTLFKACDKLFWRADGSLFLLILFVRLLLMIA